jgi:gluconate kinase
MVTKAWQEASWFGISQCDKQRKHTKQTNKQIAFIYRHHGFDFICNELQNKKNHEMDKLL